MKNCLVNYQSSVKELEANRELTEKFEAKIAEIKGQTELLAKKKILLKEHSNQ